MPDFNNDFMADQEPEVRGYDKENDLIGTQIKPVPKPEKNIGTDTEGDFYQNILNAGESGQLDLTSIESFTQISQNRNLLYNTLDIMAEDSIISSILETYTEDATQINDDGHVVWATSDNVEVAKYVNFLLDEMNVDKNSYKWIHSLIKYGDLYLKLYRESEYQDDLFSTDEEVKERKHLEEDVKINVFSKNDRYAHYAEMVYNPAEMFELIKKGKSYAYIKAPTVSAATAQKNDALYGNGYTSNYKYLFQRRDVELFEATEYVHACLEDDISRTPEEVQIIRSLDEDGQPDVKYVYGVRRGQSLLYNVFKTWRNLTLLENSILLNRLSKSSIVRVINVEVGDMPKENVGPHLAGIKNLIEQKTAFNEGKSMSEFTNPGPIENNIYVPTHNGIGSLSTQQIGGDVDVRGLGDLDYFKNKFYGSLRVPKQFFGDTDDAAGFSGGQSLSIISSRYAKSVRKIQNTFIQMLNDAINLILLDKGLDTYINRFEIHMQTPVTSEDIDKRANADAKIGIANNIISLLGESITDEGTKLKIIKLLIDDAVNDTGIADILQEKIDELEEASQAAAEGGEEGTMFETPYSETGDVGTADVDFGGEGTDLDNDGIDDFDDNVAGGEEAGGAETGGTLPSPADLGVDMTNANAEF